jgi:hypothetical protein
LTEPCFVNLIETFKLRQSRGETRSVHARVETPLILYTLPLCRRVSGFSARGHARTTGGTRQEAHCHASSHATQHFLDACAGGGGFGEVGGARRHKSGAPPLFCLPCARNLSTRGPGLGGDARLQRVRLRHLSPSSSFVCVTFFRLRHLWCAWCAWCVCVKLCRCFHVKLRQAFHSPPPSSLHLLCLP